MRKITGPMQQVAVDILGNLEVILMRTRDYSSCEEVFDELVSIIQNQSKKYFLHEDPFTGMLCTSKEYAENSLEYDRQRMIEKYGHCDGLD